MTRFLSVTAVIKINEQHGGPGAGVVDRGAIEGAVAKPAAGAVDQEFYPSLWDKAAALLSGLARTQGFSDGNKRTAWLATSTFLSINGVPLRHLHDKVAAAFVLSVSVGLLEHSDIVEVLRDGIGTDFAADDAEKAGWPRAELMYPVLSYKTLAGGMGLPGAEGMERVELGFLKLDTLAPGTAPFSSEAASCRFSFVLIPEQVEALATDLRRMVTRIGTAQALPRTGTNADTRATEPPGPRRSQSSTPKKSRSQRKRKP